MRALLIVGTLVTATLIPWDSLTVPGASPPSDRSETQAGSASRIRPVAARLSPALGIVPLAEGNASAQPGEERTLAEVQQNLEGEARESATRSGLPVGENGPRSGSSRAVPPGVVCKDGVCTIPNRQAPPAARRTSGPDGDDQSVVSVNSATGPEAAGENLTWEQARERLQQLGATHFRLEMDVEGGQYRFWCRLPVDGQSHVGRQFEAGASSDMEAVTRALEQAEAWRWAPR